MFQERENTLGVKPGTKTLAPVNLYFITGCKNYVNKMNQQCVLSSFLCSRLVGPATRDRGPGTRDLQLGYMDYRLWTRDLQLGYMDYRLWLGTCGLATWTTGCGLGTCSLATWTTGCGLGPAAWLHGLQAVD